MKYRGGDPDALHDAIKSGDRPDLPPYIRPTPTGTICVNWATDDDAQYHRLVELSQDFAIVEVPPACRHVGRPLPGNRVVRACATPGHYERQRT